MTNLRKFVVRVLQNEQDIKYNYRPNCGPFVVYAKSPRGAFRAVRNKFGGSLRSYNSCEARKLECEGSISDRIGKHLRLGRLPHHPYDYDGVL